jgi:alcohol dehydrogenase
VTKPKARALVLEEPRKLVEREFPLPEVDSATAVVRVEACGLCGTDHEQYTGALGAGFAFVPGHETVGIVEEIGDDASALWGVSAGDRVAVEVFQSCRKCPPCKRGDYRHCEAHGIGDMYGFIAVDKPPGLWGGYATHQFLGPDAVVHKVPERLDPVLATLFNPLGAGIRWAVTVPGTKPGDLVAVLGPGIRGIAATVAARKAGAQFVMVTGYGPGDAQRLEVARRFGADLTVDVATTDPQRAMREATGELADVVVNVTAKAPAAFGQAIQIVKPGGTVVMAGTSGSADTPGLWPDLIVFKEVRVLGALGVDSPAYSTALEMLGEGSYPFADIPRRIADLSTLEDLLLSMAGEAGSPPPLHGVLVP